MTDVEVELLILKLTGAVMSLARDVNGLRPGGLSDETMEKCRAATDALVSHLQEAEAPASVANVRLPR